MRALAAENARLGGALEDTPTWLNEKAKAAAGRGLKPLLTRVTAYVNGWRLVRAVQRYGAARGALLAGGIAYSAMFAIAGALAIGLTAFSLILGANQELYDSLVANVNEVLPGILITAENPAGLLDPSALILHDLLNPVPIISAFVLLWSALSLMAHLRTSIQAMFGIARLPQAFWIAKLLDLSGFVILGAGVIVSTALAAVAQVFAEPLFDALQISPAGGALLLHISGIVLALLIDMSIFAFLFRVMSGARAPVWDLLFGAFLGAVATSVVRFLGTAAVSSVANNPLLAPFTAIVTLLLWVNLVARITLLAAAFTANPPEQLVMKPKYFAHARQSPNYATKSKLATLAWDFDPVTGVVVPDVEEPTQAPIPPWRGLRAAFMRRKVMRAQERAEQAQAAYERAQAAYDAGALAAKRRDTRPTTSARAAQQMRHSVPFAQVKSGR